MDRESRMASYRLSMIKLGIPKTTYVEGEPLYNVDIWDNQGNVVRHYREVIAEEVDAIRDQYEDEPWLDVVVEEC